METLTKENFWNSIETKYPQAFEIFSRWIDEYKKEIGWNQLFGDAIFDGSNEDENNYEDRDPPKFHELPWEFQTGVMARFALECLHSDPKIIPYPDNRGRRMFERNRPHYVAECEMMFSNLQNDMHEK